MHSCADGTPPLQLRVGPWCYEAHAELQCPHLWYERSWSGDCQECHLGRSKECHCAWPRSCRMERSLLSGVWKQLHRYFHYITVHFFPVIQTLLYLAILCYWRFILCSIATKCSVSLLWVTRVVLLLSKKSIVATPTLAYHGLTQIYQRVASLGSNHSRAKGCFRTSLQWSDCWGLSAWHPEISCLFKEQVDKCVNWMLWC